jgi:hypothetical protein
MSRPDFIFSAYAAVGKAPVFVESTGTSNWLNYAALNGNSDQAGPGIIRPQITISFPYGPNALIVTSDSAGVVQMSNERWASFDASTNPPVIYPTGTTTEASNSCIINFSLLNTNYQPLPGAYFTWQLPVSIGAAVTVETSTNLTDWVPLTTVTNYGYPLFWEHLYSRPVGYFRARPQ